MSVAWIVPVVAFALVGIGMAPAQEGKPLGPKDGFDLSPTDLARVKVGSRAPDFTLEAKDGETATLSSYRGKKNLILIFYRGHW